MILRHLLRCKTENINPVCHKKHNKKGATDMTFVSKNEGNTKFKVDMSEGKYRSRRDGLLNILYHSTELPNNLYRQMNLSYDYFRKR